MTTITISLKSIHENHTMNVSLDDKIIDLKKKIHEKSGLKSKRQIFQFRGINLKNDQTFDEYGITDQDVLFLFSKKSYTVQVSVIMNVNETLSLQLARDAKVSKIYEELYIANKVEKMLYNEVELNVDKTIGYYATDDRMMINVVLRPRIEIFARTIDGNMIPLDVTMNYKIIDVKKIIYNTIKLQPRLQRLWYKNQTLLDDHELCYYNILNSDVIEVFDMKYIKIFIETEDNWKLMIKMLRSGKIDLLKKKIEELFDISESIQKITFKEKVLEDDRTMDYYVICSNDVVHVCILQLTTIFVKTKYSEMFPVNVTIMNKIIDVKKIIEKYVKIDPRRQRLMFKDRILRNEERVENCQIRKYSVILVLDELNIDMNIIAETMEGQRLQLVVKKKQSILSMKNSIGQMIYQPVERLKLLYNDIHLKNKSIIDDYDLHEGSVVKVLDKLKLAVPVCARTEDGSQYPFTVTRSDDIKDVKLKIQGILNLESNRQKLSHNRVTMKDGSQILKYSLPKNGIIDVHDEFVVIKVSIQEFNGTRSELEVNKMDSILFLKEKISEKGILQANEQELIYDGGKLINENLLKDYEIEDGCVIHTIPVWQTVAVIVRLPNTRTVVLEPKMIKTVKQFKRTIGKSTDHNEGLMDIEFNDRLLNDDALVGMSGFFHKCEVTVKF